MTPADYDFLRAVLKERSGLVLADGKQYLVENRLIPIVRRAGFAGIGELMRTLRNPREPLLADVVEAMTTNESFFFRDKVPFEQFRDTMVPALLAARPNRRIRIWCAAASTGQEPYSLAICLAEMLDKIKGWSIEIVATDISTEVIDKARAGVYNQFEVQRGLPIHLLIKYFTQAGELWRISPEIAAMVQFRPLNLLREFSHLGYFDVVFCRNVLIYFDQETKAKVLQKIARVCRADGYLVLGAAETVVGLSDAFRPTSHLRGVYAPVAIKAAGVARNGMTHDRVVPLARAR